MRILVTGAGGFVGRHLTAHLADQGDDVVGVFHVTETPPEESPNRNIQLDVTDAQAVLNALEEHEVDAVIHLAAVSYVPDAEKDPAAAIAINTGGTANFLRAIAALRPKARFLLVSSAEVYGQIPEDQMPLHEDTPLAPVNWYAASKLLAERVVTWAAERNGLDVLIARPFNHVGPGQSASFAISSFARQLAEIAAGKAEPVIKVGNLAVRRDLTDVRDVVRAYRLALEKMPAGSVFNICGGRDYRLDDLLHMLIDLTGLEVDVQVDQARLRPVDVPVFLGSCRRLREATGWTANIPIKKTLKDIYSNWSEHMSLDS